jgi:type I restriction enzyme S subunit
MKIETPYAIKNIGLFKTSQAPEMADYIFAAVTSLHGRAYLQQNQSTGTSQPYVTLGTLRSIPILIPNDKIFEQFNGKIKPIHKLMYENITENQKLAKLRDWLLPMLMNGQVTVGEAS